MYVLTNKDKHYGAAYMFDKEVMSRIAEEIGGDMVVLPSSIHESILLRKGKDTDFDTLREMVKEVNRTQLLPTEILSDEVYQYSRDTQTLSRVVASQEEFLMPDKVSMEEMHAYGYTWDGMLPLTKEEKVAECYKQWLESKSEILHYYKDADAEQLPLSEQKELKSIKNMVIREAVRYGEGYLYTEDEGLEDLETEGFGTCRKPLRN